MKRKHHDLLVWQEGIELVEEIYKISSTFPKDEIYGLTAQLRRAAVSVPSNIAEGAGRSTKKEFLYFLSIARGSLCEIETQLIIAKKLGYTASVDKVMGRMNKIFGLIGGLVNSLKNEANL